MTESVPSVEAAPHVPSDSAPLVAGPVRRWLRWLFPAREEWRQARGPLLACLLSGAFGAVVFPPVSAGILAHGALVPMLVALPRLRGSLVLWGTLLFASVWSYLNLWWLNTLVVFHPAIPLGILLLGVIVGLFALPFGLGARYVLLYAPGWLVPWGIAACWTGSEFLRCFGETAFPWNLLGHSQMAVGTAPLTQWAEKGGVPLVSFLVALSNGLLAQGWIRWQELRTGPKPLSGESLMALRRRRPLDDPDPVRMAAGYHQRRAVLAVLDFLWTAVALFFFFITAMGIQLRFERNFDFRVAQDGGAHLRVGLVQTNIDQLEKMGAYDLERNSDKRIEAGRRYVIRALELGREVAATTVAPQLLVFPEAMFIDPFFVFDPELHDVMQRFARSVGADLLFGADGWEDREVYRQRLARGRVVPDPRDPLTTESLPQLVWQTGDQGTSVGIVPLENLARFVSVYQVTPEQGLIPRVYHKVQLVPFGEHAPLLDWLPFQLAERLLWVAAFQKGTVVKQFESHGVRIGTLICFESTFGSLARDHARAGARVLAVMTNDAWYDPEYAKREGGLIGLLFRLPLLASLAAPGPDQHLIHSQFRAIETRMPVLRAANRGRSTLVLPTGRFAPEAQPLPFGPSGTLAVDVPVPAPTDHVFVRTQENGRRVRKLQEISPLTVYVRYGDWAGWGSLTTLAGVLLMGAIWRRLWV